MSDQRDIQLERFHRRRVVVAALLLFVLACLLVPNLYRPPDIRPGLALEEVFFDQGHRGWLLPWREHDPNQPVPEGKIVLRWSPEKNAVIDQARIAPISSEDAEVTGGSFGDMPKLISSAKAEGDVVLVREDTLDAGDPDQLPTRSELREFSGEMWLGSQFPGLPGNWFSRVTVHRGKVVAVESDWISFFD